MSHAFTLKLSWFNTWDHLISNIVLVLSGYYDNTIAQVRSLIIPHLPRSVNTTQLSINHSSSKEESAGFFYLQERPVLRLLLLHLLQQPLDFFSQLCLQLWLDDKVQCGRKRRAQRVNMALQSEIKEEKTLSPSRGTSSSCEFTVSTEIWICEWL